MAYFVPCYIDPTYIGDAPCQVFEASGLMKGFVFDRTVQDGPLTLTRVSALAAHIRRDTGFLYIVDPDTGEILQWDGDDINRLPFEWKSKTFVQPRPVNFAFAQVILDDVSNKFAQAVAAAYVANAALWGLPCSTGALGYVETDEYMVGGSCIEPVPTVDSEYTTLYVYADNILVDTINVLSEKLYRLSPGFKATKWEVEVAGNKGVRRITLATSAAEIGAQ